MPGTLLSTSKDKLPFEFVSRIKDAVTYKACFWDWTKQRYDLFLIEDRVIKVQKSSSESFYYKLANTSENCSFYTELKKKAKF